MIKFFRKIRKQLLTENKFSKYLIYAIGEIVLVVVGILIALSINNWNIGQVKQNEERNYLKRLVQDLKFDLIEIEEITLNNQRRLYQCTVTLKMLDAHNIPFERKKFKDLTRVLELDKTRILNQTFGFGLTAIRYYNEYNNSNGTYLELLANGKIDFIQDEQLKTSIIYYYSNIENRLQLVRMDELMRNNYVKTLAEQGISMYSNINYKEFDLLVKNKDNIIAQIENIFYITASSQYALKYNKNSVENNTKELISKIENYLD